MSHSDHAPVLPYCRNCHFTLSTPRPVHCGHCGQETDLHPPSVREMFTEYLGHYVAFDGPLWRTLGALVCLPGHLTNAYFHGQRRRYVLPLRVYLSASFLFFVGSALLPHGAETAQLETAPVAAADKAADAAIEARRAARVRVQPGETPAQAAARAASAVGGKAAVLSTKWGNCRDKPLAECSPLERALTRLTDKAENMTAEQQSARFRGLAPYGMLAMQPLFAGLLLLVFRGSGRRYAEHFVFSLHSHSLWFLALLLAGAFDLEALMIFVVFGHGLAAMRHVYGLSWPGATWRGLLLSAGYFLLLGAVTVLLGAATLIAA